MYRRSTQGRKLFQIKTDGKNMITYLG